MDASPQAKNACGVTEAQLRWAQFHHKQKARHVRATVERLWQTPASPSAVPGAFQEDARSSVSSEGRPPISRGRRALLRVSQRKLAQRRQQQSKHGTNPTNQQDEDDDELAQIFAEHTVGGLRHNHKRRRRRRRPDTVTQFEMAFRAMMQTLAAAAAPEPLPAIPSKRWTRPHQEHEVWVDFSEKWGNRRSLGATSSAAFGSTPLDRGASWLVHLPVTQKRRFSDPVPEEDDEPAARRASDPVFLERRQLFETPEKKATAAVASSPVPVPSDALGFVYDLVRQMESEADKLVSTDGKLHKPTFANLVKNYLGSQEEQQQQARRQTGSIAMRRLGSPAPQRPTARLSSGFVHNFLAQIEKPDNTRVVTVDGQLDTRAFERLVTQYLAAAADQTLCEAAGVRRGAAEKQQQAQRRQQQQQMQTQQQTPTPLVSNLRANFQSSNNKSQQQQTPPTPLVSNLRANFQSPTDRSPNDKLQQQQQQQQTPTHLVSNLRSNFQASSDKSSGDKSLQPQQTPSQLVSNLRANFQTPSDKSQQPQQQTPSPLVSNLRANFQSSSDKSQQPQQPTPSPLVSNLRASFQSPSDKPEQQQPQRTPLSTSRREPFLSPDTPDDFDQIRRETDRLTTKKMPNVTQSIFEASYEAELAAQNETDVLSPSPQGMAARVAESVSDRVGGLVKRFTFGGEDDGSSVDDKKALAAFRKTQDDRQKDETGSTSTFRSVPAGIMNVVNSFRGKQDAETMPTQTAQSFSFDESVASSLTRDSNMVSPNSLRKHVKAMSMASGKGSELPFIDTDGSEASYAGMDPARISSLLLSPTILTKRHRQALRAVESRNWDQVAYLMSANPWLAEMTDANTGQYMLHSLAYFGAAEYNIDHETGEPISLRYPPAPEAINIDLVRMHASAVHKFDQDGNLPLHLATASGNATMISLLADRFPGGASVRNEDGMLPLHLAILACATGQDEATAISIIQTVLRYFPGAVAVADNEGNLPIHIAASVLTGNLGVDVIFIVMDEADRQMSDPYGVRFRNKMTIEDDNKTIATSSTATPTNSTIDFDDELLPCNLVRNDRGETPLTATIKGRAGWEIIEAIVCSPGGVEAALNCDADRNSALHLLASNAYQDQDAIFSVLKVAPATASHKNALGMLPIEIACMHYLPPDILLAIVLEDMPIDIDQVDEIRMLEHRGASWWYLTCECDDFFVNVVEDVINFCSMDQTRAIALAKNPSGRMLVERASPRCKMILQNALRVAGRFEFDESSPVFVNGPRTMRMYEAHDFADVDEVEGEGRKVKLKCFSERGLFEAETWILRLGLDFSIMEEILTFEIPAAEWVSEDIEDGTKYLLSTEEPELTLSAVADGMLQSAECQTNESVRQRYAAKVFSVLRIAAKALRHLHSIGLVHGRISTKHCCKYRDSWKLRSILSCQKIDEPYIFSQTAAASLPPECWDEASSFQSDYLSTPAMDSWAFGKMSYEVLVGRDWPGQVDNIQDEMIQCGVFASGAELLQRCLDENPGNRPSMEAILNSSLWNDLRDLAAAES